MHNEPLMNIYCYEQTLLFQHLGYEINLAESRTNIIKSK